MVVGRRINSGAVSLCDAHPRVVLNFRTVFSEGRKKIKSSGMFLLVFEFITSVQITLTTWTFPIVVLNRWMFFFLKVLASYNDVPFHTVGHCIFTVVRNNLEDCVLLYAVRNELADRPQ